ncbi:MAG: phosphomannomutase [Symbiopectobacterium sp.]|uniref:phosphomannomutase n=1 Tax=Symbiopectobacterium sp. TaxID=2952789 RepID=UPI0039EC3323
MLKANSVIKSSRITFGTSGARGLVVDFTSDVCAAFTHVFLSVVKGEYKFDSVAIAVDNRPSSLSIAKYVASAIEKHNLKVVYYGVVPTPALAFRALADNVPCIMITGSHIPFDRNGMKFYSPNGEITKENEIQIIESTYEFNTSDEFSELVTCNDAAQTYIERYTSIFSDKPLLGKRVGVYEHSSAGRELYAKIFSTLGANVISLGRSDKFVPIDTEAISDEDSALALKWVEEYKLDTIFSTDGDGDRPLVADENGKWLRGDILGLLCADKLGIEAVAVPVSCNTVIEKSGKFKCVKRTKSGSPYVIDAFSELTGMYSSIAGFEANGGFILGSDVYINNIRLSALPTRDAVLPALMLISSIREQPISSLVDSLSARYTSSDRLKDFPINRSEYFIGYVLNYSDLFISEVGLQNMTCSNIDTTDGVRMLFNNGDIIHLRPSGNAPELRCYAESSKQEMAKKYVEVTLMYLSTASKPLE